MLALSVSRRSTGAMRRAAPLAVARRSIWGAEPVPVSDPLYVPMENIESPVPLFDGATPTKVHLASDSCRACAALAGRLTASGRPGLARRLDAAAHTTAIARH